MLCRAHSLVHGAAAAALVSMCAAAAAAAAGPPDVSVQVMPSTTDGRVGRSLIYNVLVANRGGSDVTQVDVEVTIAGTASATVADATPSAGACSAATGRVSCSIGALARGASAKVRIQLTPTLPGTLDVSAKSSTPGDSNASNDAAAASVTLRPGREGPPTIRPAAVPRGAAQLPRDPRAASVAGRVDLSEPGVVRLRVVDRRLGTALPMLAGSTIGSTKLARRQTSVSVPAGGPGTVGAVHMLYDVRLPFQRLKPKRTYALVVDAVDLENERAAPVEIRFELLVPRSAAK